jgi:putative ABC transport system permease protein
MITNYIKIAIRNLLKQKGLTFINVLGLSIGLACFSLFLLYAVNEFSFDRFHKKADRTYRMYRWTAPMNGKEPEGDIYLPMPLGPAIKADFPDVEQIVRIRGDWGEELVRTNDNIHQLGICFADPEFFQVFDFPLLYGDSSAALFEQNSLVITEKTALQLFGESNPTGRTLEIKYGENYVPFKVTAVAKNLPVNSTIVFELLGNFQYWENRPENAKRKNNWNHSAYQTFVQLRPGSGLANDAERLLQFRRKYYPNEENELRELGYWKGSDAPVRYGLQPLCDMHTNMKIGGGDVPPTDPEHIWILLAIAGGVLLIACINFTTLAIGRSARRAREVGVRKVVGSSRVQLVGQFLTEAMLLVAISAALGVVLGQTLLPYFNDLSGRELVFSLKMYPEIGWLSGGLVLLVGLLAGSYPALTLSGFKPLDVLKSKVRLGGSNLFTKSLVTVQFVLSVGLIISTLVILRQLQFMQSQHPGFQKENVVVIDANRVDTKKVYPLFLQSVRAQPGVLGVTGSEISLGAGMGWSLSSWNFQGQSKEAYEYFVDKDYLGVMGIPLLAGRNFNPAIATDTINSVIVNEAFVRDFNWTNETAIGQQLSGYYEREGSAQPVIIGVVKNFHFRPFKEEIKPQLFHQFADYQPHKFLVRLNAGDPAPALSALEKTWNGLVSDVPFKYSFLDEDLNKFYRAEQRWSKIIGWAGGISIFLACLGLFGLAALAAVNRTREIGIRRVLGASVPAITGLLSKDFVRLVLIATVIAVPLAWYFMSQWLDNFAYRISLEWWVFALSGAGAIAIAFLTVSVQSIKAALDNPVNSLRNE